MIIGDTKLFESKAQELARSEFKDWWTNSVDTSHSFRLYIIHQNEFYKAIMGWTGRLDSTVQPQSMKIWDDWEKYKGDISMNELNQDLDALLNGTKNNKIFDIDDFPDGTMNKDLIHAYWNNRDCNISHLMQDYNWIKQNEDKYLVRGSMIPFLYNKLNMVWEQNLYKDFHVLKSDHVNALCNNIKWQKLEEEIDHRKATPKQKGTEMHHAHRLITKCLQRHYGENTNNSGVEWYNKYGIFWVFTDDTKCGKDTQTHWMATSIKFERTPKKKNKDDANKNYKDFMEFI